MQHCTSDAAGPLSNRPSHSPENCERQDPTQARRANAARAIPKPALRQASQLQFAVQGCHQIAERCRSSVARSLVSAAFGGKLRWLPVDLFG
jgi:hypothetical protein